MNTSKFIIVSHRGYSSKCPENTFSSFDLSIQKGCNHIEFDLQLTKDKIPIVIHDDTVNRTTNGIGNVRDLTYKEISYLNAGLWFKTSEKLFTNEKIPRFDEMIERYSKKTHMYIELKSSDFMLVEIVAELLQKRDVLKMSSNDLFEIPNITIISFNKELLKYSKKVLPFVRHGFLSFIADQDNITTANNIGCYAIFPYYLTINESFVQECSERALFVGSWGFSNVDQVIEIIPFGVRGVTVDWPLEVDRIMNKKFDWYHEGS